jgi:hypothetical protein
MEILELGITKMCEARCKAWAKGFIRMSTSQLRAWLVIPKPWGKYVSGAPIPHIQKKCWNKNNFEWFPPPVIFILAFWRAFLTVYLTFSLYDILSGIQSDILTDNSLTFYVFDLAFDRIAYLTYYPTFHPTLHLAVYLIYIFWHFIWGSIGQFFWHPI